GLEALERIGVKSGQCIGVLLRDLLDLDPALGREHVQELLRASIERDRQVVLLRDLRRTFDPELLHHVAADVETEDVVRTLLRLRRIVGELDAARLAATAGQHLRLDNHWAAELLRGSTRLLRRRRKTTFRNGDTEARKELLALILVEIHGAGLYLPEQN